MSLADPLLLILPALVIVAAQHDATTMTIPNWISAALIAAFVPAAFVVGLPASAWGLSAAVGAGALVAGIGMYALRWIGGGDAKLFAAGALWMGWEALAPFLLWTAMAGGLLALGLLSARRVLAFSGLPAPRAPWIGRLLEPAGDIPYGIAIAAGALLAYPDSPLMRAPALPL